MLAASTAFKNLDLPVFRGERVFPYAWMRPLDYNQESFIRGSRIHVPLRRHGAPGRQLTDILKRTDEELEHVAQLCGSRVVAHTWGLAQLAPHQQEFYKEIVSKRPRLPSGYILAAEVELIAGDDRLDYRHPEAALQIQSGLDAYYGQAGLKLSDMGSNQFMLDSRSQDLVLVDIEPRWAWLSSRLVTFH